MPSISHNLATLRASLGNAVLRGDIKAAADYRRALKAARLEEQMQRELAEAPTLTPEQIDRLRSVLATIGGAA